MTKLRTRGGRYDDRNQWIKYHGNQPSTRGIVRTSKRNARAMLRRLYQWRNNAQLAKRFRWVRVNPNVAARSTSRTRKLELMEQARRAGWNGRTYHSAKKFERKIERQARAAFVPVERSTRKPGWRRWFVKGRR